MANTGLTVSQPPEGLSQVDAVKIIHQSPQSHEITNENNTDSSNDIAIQWPPSHIPINSSLPKTTIATKASPQVAHYIDRSAENSTHATLTDSLGLVFEIEKFPDKFKDTTSLLIDDDYTAMRYNACLARLHTKLNTGSLIVEAAGFAATACWTPAAHSVPPSPGSVFDTIARQGRPIFADFMRRIEAARERHLYPINNMYWHMSLMARDSRREYVPGAVRAVIDPFLLLAKAEGVPVWLEAGSPQARDVYAHFGLVVVEAVVVNDVTTWCMIKR